VTPTRLREDPAGFAADVKQVLLRARMRRMPGDLVVRDAA